MGIIDERRRDKLAESLREEYIRMRRKTHPHFFLNTQMYGDGFWAKIADKLIPQLGHEFSVPAYIKTLFDKYGSASHAPPMNMIASNTLITLFKSGVFEEHDEKCCIKHLLNMERLYMSYRRFRTAAEVLTDDTIYLNALFRYVKAVEEKCFHIAELYEVQAWAFLNENAIYKKVLDMRLPEKLRCH